MGQSGYCCASGQSCAWDDAGKVACCASGSTCQGSASYAAGANNGGQWSTSSWQPTSSAYNVVPITTTVYQQQPTTTTNCNCEQQTTYLAPVPVVPITKATLETSYYTTPAAQTTTYVPQQYTTVVPQGQQPSTVGLVACPTVQTVTYHDVGAPVRTQGCFVIINAATARFKPMSGFGTTVISMVGLWFWRFWVL